MDKVKKVISINLLALFGWFNIILQSFLVNSAIKSYPIQGSEIAGISLMFMFGVMINLALIGIALFSLLIEYLCKSPNAKWAFKFPYEKIRPQSLYNVFFFGGFVGLILPFITPMFFK